MPIYRSPVLKSGVPTPAMQGVSAWSFDPVNAGNSSILTGGTVYLVKIENPPAHTVTKVYWAVATQGGTPTAGQNYVGLYDSAGTRLATTDADADVTGTGLKTTTITGQLLVPGSFYWAAFLFNAGVIPTLARASTGTAAMGAANAGTTAATTRFGVGGTSQTTLPTSITPANITAATFTLWAALGT